MSYMTTSYYGAYYTHAPSTELYHFGVPGMKWGVRKASNKTTNKKYSKDYLKTEKLRKKSYKELSNQELKDLNNRMNLEQNYNRLNPGAAQKGYRYVKTALAVAGTGLAVSAMVGQYGKLGKQIVDSMRG